MSLDLLNTALMMMPLNWFYHRSLSGTTGGSETIDVIPILNNCFPPIAPNQQKRNDLKKPCCPILRNQVCYCNNHKPWKEYQQITQQTNDSLNSRLSKRHNRVTTPIKQIHYLSFQSSRFWSLFLRFPLLFITIPRQQRNEPPSSWITHLPCLGHIGNNHCPCAISGKEDFARGG